MLDNHVANIRIIYYVLQVVTMTFIVTVFVHSKYTEVLSAEILLVGNAMKWPKCGIIVTNMKTQK